MRGCNGWGQVRRSGRRRPGRWQRRSAAHVCVRVLLQMLPPVRVRVRGQVQARVRVARWVRVARVLRLARVVLRVAQAVQAAHVQVQEVQARARAQAR